MEFEKTEKMIELEHYANEAYGRWLLWQAKLKELEELIKKEERNEYRNKAQG